MKTTQPRPEHSSMTILARVRPGEEAALEGILRGIGREAVDDRYTALPFPKWTRVHFCRLLLLPPPQHGGGPCRLAFATDHDVEPGESVDAADQALLRRMFETAAPGVERIFGHCEGWPGGGTPDARVRYLLDRRVPYAARHIACRRRSVAQLRSAVEARTWIGDELDRSLRPELVTAAPRPAGDADGAAPTGDEADALLQAARLQGKVPDLAGPASDASAWARLAGAGLGAATLLGVALYLLGRRSPALAAAAGVLALAGPPAVFLARLRRHEAAEAAAWERTDPPTLDELNRLRTWEDNQVQNQMTHLVPLRAGAFRRRTAAAVFRVIDFLAAHHWNRGRLGAIPTIHFARWILIDGGTRVLFLSNYDGSWESYLGDFIDRAASGLTAVWSNAAGFPPSRFLIGGGARNAEAFKNWARAHQVETLVWYSAYPGVSVRDHTRALALLTTPTSAPDWARNL